MCASSASSVSSLFPVRFRPLCSLRWVVTALSTALLLNACSTPPTQDGTFFVGNTPPNSSTRLIQIQHSRMVIGFNPKTNTAAYVAERLTPDLISGTSERDHLNFREDDKLPEKHQVNTRVYTRSGYDRGHLAPAADFKGDANAMKESFLTSNVAPQDPQLNRGLWSRLEDSTRDCAKKVGGLYVLTGVTHPSRLKKLRRKSGKAHEWVAIPNSFWKLVVSGKNYRAYIFPNDDPNSSSFANYEVSLDELEKLTKIELLPAAQFGANTKRNTGSLCTAQFGLARR